MAECVHTLKPTGFVYFIASPAMNALKIGYSAKHPRTRLNAMQTGNADELELIGWCDGTVALEQHWHRFFDDYWIRGEWFRLEGHVADFIRAFREHYWSEFGERQAA